MIGLRLPVVTARLEHVGDQSTKEGEIKGGNIRIACDSAGSRRTADESVIEKSDNTPRYHTDNYLYHGLFSDLSEKHSHLYFYQSIF